MLAVCTIAFAIGLTTGIFSVVNAVLLRPLPYADPDRLVAVGKVWRTLTSPVGVSEPELLDWRERARSFEGIEFSARRDFALLGSTSSQWILGAAVSQGLFDLLGVRPILGRNFLPGEDASGRDLVVIISERLWRTRFGADPAIIGTRLRLNPWAGPETNAYEVIGVLPATVRLRYSASLDLFVPHVFLGLPRASGARRSAGLSAVARLKHGVSIEQASAEMRDLMTTLNREYPMGILDSSAAVRPLHDHLFGGTRRVSVMLLGAVAVVLLIATVNIANLLLTRGYRRHREMAVRLAIGSSRRRLVQQVASECTVLAVLGGAGGVLLSIWVTRIFSAFAPASLPRIDQASLDWRVLVFSIAITFVCAMCAAILPTLHASRIPPSASMQKGTATGDRGTQRFRAGVIMAQCALVLALLAGAALLVNSVWRLTHLRFGFDPKDVLTVQVLLPPRWSWEQGRRPEFDRRVLERVRALPGVVAASTSSDVPMSTGSTVGVQIEGHEQIQMMWVTGVDATYLSLLQIPLVAGRPISEDDTEHTHRVALVNRAFVRKFSPNRDALGRRLTLRDTHEVVGVVEDISELTDGTRLRRGLVESTLPAVYIPIRQLHWSRQVYIVVRATGAPGPLARAVIAAIHAIDPEVTTRETASLEDLVGRATVETRFYAAVLVLFGAVALLLAGVGVYGVVSQAAAERMREFGIRLALGAKPSQILKLVLRQTAAPVAIGIVAGLAIAWPATRILKSLLFNVTPADLPTFAAAGLILAGVGLIAAWLPARFAARVNPIEVLRSE